MISNTSLMLDKILKNQKCISLTTYKRNGEGVPTPVWFSREDDDIYIMTKMQSWKARRIRNNPNVSFMSCSYRGKIRRRFKDLRVHGNAEFVEGEEKNKADRSLARKYWFLYRFFRREEDIFLKISISAILKAPDEEACTD